MMSRETKMLCDIHCISYSRNVNMMASLAWHKNSVPHTSSRFVERSGSVVELRTLGFESCPMGSNHGQVFFTLHCSSSLRCMNEYLAIDSFVYLYEQLSRINSCIAECFQEKLRWCLLEQVWQ